METEMTFTERIAFNAMIARMARRNRIERNVVIAAIFIFGFAAGFVTCFAIGF